MPQPTGGPASLETTRLQAGLRPDNTQDDEYLEDLVIPATNDVVRAMRIAQAVDVEDPETDPWPARIVMGASMLAARLYRRRNSPSGVEAFTDQGVAYVQRNDPDIAQLLQIGKYAKPLVG